MAVRRTTLTCLALAITFFCVWTSTNDLRGPSDDRSRLLAIDTLRVARDSVHAALRSLLEVYEDEPRVTSARMTYGHSGNHFKQLQSSLDNLGHPFSHRNVAYRPVQGRHISDTDHIDPCPSLAGKRITMIGGEHIYRLHLLLLQHRERAEGKLFPCQYHEFCTHHHICLPSGYDDTHPPRYVKSPTTQELIETESALVNYVVSDALFSAGNESSWQYNLPWVDPMTGIRLRETYWLSAARKANLVILGRDPLSAPGETYVGNWSFLHQVPDYMDTAIISEYKSERADVHQANPLSLEILNAAVHLTVSRFLPDVFQLLRSIRREVRPTRQKRLIWPGSWYRLPGRGIARAVLLRPHVHTKAQDVLQQASRHGRPYPSAEDLLTLQLSAFITADITNATSHEDPWTLLFNAQVYMQNMVLRELLPQCGIVFLSLDTPWVGDNRARGHGRRYYQDTAIDVERERTATIGEAFLTGMDQVVRYPE